MPWYVLIWVLGSDIYLYQETLYRSESWKRKIRRTSPCGPPGMATRVRPIYRRCYSCSAILCRSTWLLHFLHLFCLSFIKGMPNRSCILKLRTNQCFVCNFLSMPRCKTAGVRAKLRRRKQNVLVALQEIFDRNMLTPFQVVSDSKSKVFGGSNLFQSLLVYRVVEVNLIAREVPGHPH